MDSGPPVEYGLEELSMVRQLQWWWKRSLEKGHGKEVIANSSNGVNIHVGGNDGGPGRTTKMKYKPRRGGKVVNLNSS
jgi:hypothetical protein